MKLSKLKTSTISLFVVGFLSSALNAQSITNEHIISFDEYEPIVDETPIGDEPPVEREIQDGCIEIFGIEICMLK